MKAKNYFLKASMDPRTLISLYPEFSSDSILAMENEYSEYARRLVSIHDISTLTFNFKLISSLATK